ncbi:MAG: LysR substrate-binding domain-containing protein [Alphaproteobacteria bacterium]|nr:LysR substrate-binding domain-containing protein [Alphaproteobacteria bacterium]
MLTELKTFVAVARFGTFAAAGDRMGLTQSAVSGQMKRLEEKLGQPLFARTGRSAVLNETGRRVLARAGDLLALADTLADPIEPDAQTGRLRVGAIASMHPTILRRALPMFSSEFLKVQVQVVPGTSLDLLDQIDAGDLDLAIIILPGFGLPPTLSWKPLLQERFVLATPLSWKIDTLQDALSTLPFLRYNRTSFGGRQVERFLDGHRITTQDRVELDDIPTILMMVSDGFGIAIIPETEAYAAELSQVQIIAIDQPDFVREIGIIGPSDSTVLSDRFAQLCGRVSVSPPALTDLPV